MMEETLDHISPLLPVDFFSIVLDLHRVEKKESKVPLKKKYLLPDLSDLLSEKSFAKVSMGYNEDGLVFDVGVNKAFEECYFPEFDRGDNIELFIDTRDLKSAGFLTKFCHHFVIFPKAINEMSAKEITRFRTEDRHELCDEKLISVKGDFKQKSYSLKIFIPSRCLYGYDPITFDRLGMTYRINRLHGAPQHFAVSSDYLATAQQPSLWASLKLKE